MTETNLLNLNYKNYKIKNFISLLKLDFNLYGKQIFIAPLVVNLVFIFSTLIRVFIKKFVVPYNIFNSYDMNLVTYLFISLFIGVILTSNSFKHLHQEEKAINFYMVPATIFEKFLSILLYYFFFYLIISILSTIIAFLINNIIVYLFFKVFYPLNLIKTLFNLKTISTYFFACSIFMLGSTYFKKNSFLLTILTLLAISMIYSMFSGILFLFIFKNTYFHSFMSLTELLSRIGLSIKTIFIIIEIVKFLLSIFFYFLTYLRIVEYDVKGE